MRKFLTSVFVVFVGASVFGVTTAVAQNKSELPIFVAEDSNSVCQPGLVNLSEMAGKVKAHSIRLNELECWGNDMGNKVRLLANQADEASQKTTAENKTVAEELQKQTKAADAKVRRLRQQIKEIREIQGGSAFAQRLRQVLVEEAAKDAKDTAKVIGGLKIAIFDMNSRLSTVEADVAELKELTGVSLTPSVAFVQSSAGTAFLANGRLCLPAKVGWSVCLAGGVGGTIEDELAWSASFSVPRTFDYGRLEVGPVLSTFIVDKTGKPGISKLVATAGGEFLLHLGPFTLGVNAGAGVNTDGYDNKFGYQAGLSVGVPIF